MKKPLSRRGKLSSSDRSLSSPIGIQFGEDFIRVDNHLTIAELPVTDDPDGLFYHGMAAGLFGLDRLISHEVEKGDLDNGDLDYLTDLAAKLKKEGNNFYRVACKYGK